MGDTAGALWAYVMEPDAAHEVARSRDLAVILYEEALAQRLPEGAKDLKPLNADAGIFGDAKLNTLTPVAGNEPPTRYPVSWLMSDRLAKAWQAVVTGKPF